MNRDGYDIGMLKVREFILERFSFHYKQLINKRDFEPVLKLYIRDSVNHIVYHMAHHIYGKNQDKKITFRMPKS